MIRVSPSLLQKWVDLQTGAWNTQLVDLEDYILGVYKPSKAALRGTAYHKLLEKGGEPFYRDGKYVIEVEGEVFTFSHEAALPALTLRVTYANMVHEVWASRIFEIEGEQVISWMRLDGLSGLSIHDAKTTSRPKKYVDYYEALQWRMYMLGVPDVFDMNYHIFVLNEENTTCQYSTLRINNPGEEILLNEVLPPMGDFVKFLHRRRDLWSALQQKAQAGLH